MKRHGNLEQNASKLHESEHGHHQHVGGGTLQGHLLQPLLPGLPPYQTPGPKAGCYWQTARQLHLAVLQLRHYPQGRHPLKKMCRKAAAPRPNGLPLRAAQWHSGDGRRFLHLCHRRCQLHNLAVAVAEEHCQALMLVVEPQPLLILHPVAAETVLTLVAWPLPAQGVLLPAAAPLQHHLRLKGATTDV